MELDRYHKEVKNFLGYSKHNLHQFSRWQVKTNMATLLGSQEDISGAWLGLALSGELTLGSDAREACGSAFAWLGFPLFCSITNLLVG